MYEKILRGQPYTDIIDDLRSEHREQIIKTIQQYRTVEARDMIIKHRAKVTGLTKTTCEKLNRVYERISYSAAT